MRRDFVTAVGLLGLLVGCGSNSDDSGGTGGMSASGASGGAGGSMSGAPGAGAAGRAASGGSGALGGGAGQSAGATGGSGGTGVGGGSGGQGAGTGGAPASGGTGGTPQGGSSGSGAASGMGTGAGMGGTGIGGTGMSGSAGTGTAGTAAGGMGGGGTGGAGSTHWVGTWTASPYYDSGNQPPASMSNAVLRQVVHVSLGGSQLRFQFSNLGGNGSVTLNSVHIALCKATPAVDSTIDTTTDKALAFSGMPNVTIAQNKEVWSDPIDFTVPPLGNITITIAFGSVPSQVVGHSGARTTSYLQTASTNVTAASMTSAQTFAHWYYISGIDVMAPTSAVGVVAIGDSITDGRGTDDNHNNRWTDVLAARLQGNPPTANVAMMNQGIGATNLIGTSGTAAQARFDRDVLGQSAVKYAIVLDGVNDIGSSNASYDSLKNAYDDLIKRAHAKSVLIYGGTITPFGANSYYSAAHEMVRQQVNTYIKSGAFDGYIDFDAALTDGGSPPKLQEMYATWSQEDGLHPGPAGYQKMGQTPDLALFTK